MKDKILVKVVFYRVIIPTKLWRYTIFELGSNVIYLIYYGVLRTYYIKFRGGYNVEVTAFS